MAAVTQKECAKSKETPTMDKYLELLEWAKDQGIELQGIEPQALPGRGIGIVATKVIQVCLLSYLFPKVPKTGTYEYLHVMYVARLSHPLRTHFIPPYR